MVVGKKESLQRVHGQAAMRDRVSEAVVLIYKGPNFHEAKYKYEYIKHNFASSHTKDPLPGKLEETIPTFRNRKMLRSIWWAKSDCVICLQGGIAREKGISAALIVGVAICVRAVVLRKIRN